jgi:hypothetical protein
VNISAYPAMLEKDWQKVVLAIAKKGGWIWHHELPSQRASGRWSTHACGEPGFPDLILVHPSGQLVVAELKTAKGRTTKHQEMWLKLLQEAGVEVHVWRPSDRSAVEMRLIGWKYKNQ